MGVLPPPPQSLLAAGPPRRGHRGARPNVIGLMQQTPGLCAYYLVRAGGDTVSVTITDDAAAGAASNEMAANWIRENVADGMPAAPEIFAGEVAVTTGG